MPYTHRVPGSAGSFEFSLVFDFTGWTGTSFSLTMLKSSSSPNLTLHLFSAGVFDFSGVSAGNVVVMHFVEIFTNHYLVSKKVLSATQVVSATS